MSEVLVIGEPEVVEGFALAGTDVESSRDPERVAWMVPELIRSSAYGIVLVTETIYDHMDEKVRARAEASARPLFVTIPAAAGTELWGGEDTISRIIRRAIGYRLKIKR
jgi:vacuolar-type H+-ATPase subunit F/Vma7